MDTLDDFIEQWADDSSNKKGFIRLLGYLKQLEDISLEFVPREGITYSLRAKYTQGDADKLFAMVDVIEDNPRWLSACFYAEMTTDPQSEGNYVPGGLLGEDAVCFDMDSYSDELAGYLEARIKEAYEKSVK